MKRFLTATLLTGLLGCTTGDIVLDMPAAGYVVGARARVEAADWSQAEIVAVELSEFKFEPSDLAFQEGIAYRLVLRNTGDRTHTFVSENFFKAIATEKLVTADGMIATPYLRAIAVRSGEEKELRFVPVRKGTYGLECTILLHSTFGMEGRITIQ